VKRFVPSLTRRAAWSQAYRRDLTGSGGKQSAATAVQLLPLSSHAEMGSNRALEKQRIGEPASAPETQLCAPEFGLERRREVEAALSPYRCERTRFSTHLEGGDARAVNGFHPASIPRTPPITGGRRRTHTTSELRQRAIARHCKPHEPPFQGGTMPNP
jgi:hypothetical protein